MSSDKRKASRYEMLIAHGKAMGELTEVRKRIQQLTEKRMAPYKVREGEGSHDASHDLSILLNSWLTKHGGEIVQSCSNCRNMKREGPATCTKFNMTPPIDVIMHGCPAYEDDGDIPF